MNEAKQNQTPLIDALRQFAAGNPAYFRIPAHRFGKGVDETLAALLGKQVFTADLTEAEGLDDLHAATGVIAEAEALAADLWGSESCHFLVNGSTGGNEAMLLSVLRPEDKILTARNVHKSVLMGLILTGAVPVWMYPDEVPGWQLDGPVSVGTVERSLDEHPDCKAVMLVSPTYFGICSPVREIAALCHERNILLLVDEAHGPHLHFMKNAPEDAVSAGADLVVQSLHKTGGSMTQSSLLHVQGPLADRDRIRESLALTMSTSPSYVLMASLDGARHQLAMHGRSLTEQAEKLALYVRTALASVPGIEVLDLPCSDPLRLVFSAGKLGISGEELSRRLYETDFVSLELADACQAAAVITWGNTREDVERLVNSVRTAMQELRQKAEPFPNVSAKTTGAALFRETAEAAVSPRTAWYAAAESVPLEKTGGRIAAESVIPYPPGIPVLYPGEKITPEMTEYLMAVRMEKTALHGPSDRSLTCLRVLK